MDIRAVTERVEHLARIDADPGSDAATIEAALIAARQVSSWVDARQASLVAKLSSQVSFPEAAIAAATKGTLGQAAKTKERSDTLGHTPNLAAGLGDGAITAGHVDALTRCSKSLDDRQRGELFDRVDRLSDVAAAATVDEFRRRVQLEVRSLQSDDGADRLERQRRNTHLRSWVDTDGMWCLHGRFDPVTGLAVSAKITNAIDALFAESTPQHCPSDAIEKQQFLAAHALARLLDGSGGTRSARPEYLAVIDADAPGRGPDIHFAIPIELPARVIADLAQRADTSAVVVRNGVVLYAPGDTDLGRTTRLANRAQRRALRGLYATCAIPGCHVHYDRCELHHIIWWRHGGHTDLSNLIPVCIAHHGKIHNDGWTIALGPNRELTLTLPDGTTHNTGPPTIRAA